MMKTCAMLLILVLCLPACVSRARYNKLQADIHSAEKQHRKLVSKTEILKGKFDTLSDSASNTGGGL